MNTNSRRWLQFSLRTMLIFITLICVACGLWLGPKARRHSLVRAIEVAGGKIHYAAIPADESWFARTQRQNLPRDYLDEINAVDLSNCKSFDFAGLRTLTGLQWLVLSDTQVTDAGLVHLKGLTGLRGLYLDHTQVTDAGLVHLKGLTGLQWLILPYTQVTDAGLVHLQGLTGLQWLRLDNTQVTNAGVEELTKALPNCRIGH